MEPTITLGDILGTVLGSILAISAALGAFLIERRRRNRQLVRNLADDLSARRALAEIRPRESPHEDEASRCRSSVQAAQDRISQIRDEVHPNESLRKPLQKMVFLCVAYKEAVELEPERWQYELMALRDGLLESLAGVEQALGLQHASLPTPGSWQKS